MLSPREVVLKIQNDKRHTSDSNKKDLNNAITLISKDLYASDNHFILELIQNAEDNKYDRLPRDADPFLIFILFEDKIVIQNNEDGFREEDVRSICSVGQSTKNKSFGQIGEKGIGFKSVFKVSEEPHIYSAGYQFKLSSKDLPDVKYIFPYWVEDAPDYIDADNTNIALPLKEGVKEELSDKIADVKPSVILFLNKLKKIIIENRISNTISTITKRNILNDILLEVKINESLEVKKWRLIKNTLTVPDGIEGVNRDELKTVDIALAFPLNLDGTPDSERKQDVHAFLPVNTYGFKFIVQSDFILTSGRELLQECKWNDWLKNNIAEAFLKAVDNFKEDEKLRTSFYAYLPLDGDLEYPFQMVDNQIYDCLKNHDCILSQSGQWLNPSSVVHANKDIRGIISNDDLIKFFGLQYTSEEAEISAKVRDKLGIKNLSPDMLFECLSDHDWVKTHNNEWFLSLYTYLCKSKIAESDKNIKLLKTKPIIKLGPEKVSSADALKTFLSVSNNQEVYGFEDELQIIDEDLYALIKAQADDSKSKVIEFLNALGVREAQPIEIIDFILSVYEDDSDNGWRGRSFEHMVGYVKYIKNYYEDYYQANRNNRGKLNRLNNSIRIFTHRYENRPYFNVPNKTYLPNSYGSSYDLEKLFYGICSRFVSDYYLKDVIIIDRELSKLEKQIRQKTGKSTLKNKKQHVINDKIDRLKNKKNDILKEWRIFFTTIGVNEIPAIEYYEGPILRDPINLYPHPYETNHLHRNEKIEDYRLSSEFREALKQESQQTFETIIEILDRHWEYYSSLSVMNYYYDYRNKRKTDKLESSFIRDLRKHVKMPTTDGRLLKPREVYLKTKETSDIYGNSVPYSSVNIKNKNFLDWLEIKTEVTTLEVLEVLRNLKRNGSKETESYKNIYTYLESHFLENSEIIIKSFSTESLIYNPSSNNFSSINNTLWEDQSDIFGNHCIYIANYYQKQKHFFINLLGIKVKADLKFYCTFLQGLSRHNITTKDEVVILKVYEAIDKSLRQGDLSKVKLESWWNDFLGGKILLTEKNTLESNKPNILFNDNNDLYDLFQNDEDITFLKLPPNYYPKIQKFLQLFDVQSLDTSVNIELLDTQFNKVENQTVESVKSRIEYILRYLYKNDHDAYERVKSNNLLSTLKNLPCYVSDSLNVNYTLKDIIRPSQKPIYLSNEGLFVRADYQNSAEDIIIELSKLFKSESSLDDFLMILVERRTNDDIERYLKSKKIDKLPPDELKYFELLQSENYTLLKGNTLKPINIIQEDNFENLHNKEESLDEQRQKESFVSPDKHTNSIPIEESITSYTSSPIGETSGTASAYIYCTDGGTQKNIGASKSNIWVPDITPTSAPIRVRHEKSIIRVDESSSSDIFTDNDRQNNPHEHHNHSSSLNSYDLKRIGYWGEAYAVEVIKKFYTDKYSQEPNNTIDDTLCISQDGNDIVSIKWLNKNSDIGEGHDIQIIENNVKHLIEVKSTTSNNEEWVDISDTQWEYAKKYGANYHIYRIYNVGSPNVYMYKFDDPYRLWQEGTITIRHSKIKILF